MINVKCIKIHKNIMTKKSAELSAKSIQVETTTSVSSIKRDIQDRLYNRFFERLFTKKSTLKQRVPFRWSHSRNEHSYRIAL